MNLDLSKQSSSTRYQLRTASLGSQRLHLPSRNLSWLLVIHAHLLRNIVLIQLLRMNFFLVGLILDALAEPVTHSPNDNSAPLILEDEISSMYDLIDSSLSSSSLLHASSGSYMTHMQDMSMQQKVSTVVPQPHHSPPSSRRAHSTNAAQAASSSLHPIAESATASNKENLPSALHFANSYYYPIPTSGTQPHGTKSYHIPDIHRTALAGHTLNAPYAAVANQPFMSQPYSAGVIGHHRGILSIHNIGH
ncbi:hypothetical protein DL96DRAFT_78773 [Flagelloscypha sp. PMI_526]|nr:hypothetical protein DL96DRAFT_78773 [Flagelloscypha sp. PMI_526]